MSLLPNFRNMLAFIDPKVHEFASADSQRSAVAGALYDVANEHAKGICTLLENHHYASAFALTRSLFETFVRAAWILHCATDKEFNTFVTKDKIELESKERFTFGEMVKAVEKARDWPDTLSGIKDHAWNALNSYAHGGQLQVTRRYDGVTIQPHHDPEQVDEIVRFSAMLTFLTFSEIAEISGSEEMHVHAEALYKKISPWCFNKALKNDA
ncbi:DUF5677 domain-containing protein [Marinimicrobium sp. C6131]|uniref:DUF6988 family protein n=1 Tax=Marinimicrobium sp. C6131 TaxID=3022676 RepID=UPI00223D683C|nr:DUF5677 domain-containing protein [Marinimicrobium sp. C6131]UZJ43811.1 DUF5677 domain-containing protein [Marinimicrobium sp. C6131]